MIASASLIRLLDPLGGDDFNHPDRLLRLNLRRVELMATLALVISIIETAFSSRRAEHYLEACIIIGLISCVFIGVARAAQGHSTRRASLIPDVFIAYVLLSSLTLCLLVALTGHMIYGFLLVYLSCAIFFLIPPTRFAVIGVLVLTVYLAITLAAPITPFQRFISVFNSALAIFAGAIGRWALDRLQKTSDAQLIEIARQNAQLKQQNDELNALMAIAAHDLRSPLLGLRNLLQLASERPPRSAKAWEELLAAAGGGIDSMQHLISRILAAHEVEGDSRVELSLVCIHHALHQAVLRHSPTAERHDIELVLDLSSEPLHVISNSHALEQILDNLISNAIRFSFKGSTINLSAMRKDRLHISIRDHGVGLDEQSRCNLFSKFGRGAIRPINGSWGSGMGLFIVKKLCESIAAEVTYAPTPNGGATFQVTLQENGLASQR